MASAAVPAGIHFGEEIRVRINDQDYTLADAITSRELFTSSTNLQNSPDKIKIGHDSNEIFVISLGKTIQEAINDGDFIRLIDCNYGGEIKKSGEIFIQTELSPLQTRRVVCTDGDAEPLLDGGGWTPLINIGFGNVPGSISNIG